MITINNLAFENIKRFVLFDLYYQEMMSLDLNKDVVESVNKLMDYHFKNIYGEQYNHSSGILDNKFISVTEFEE